jgi:hypothetical protein
VELDVSRSSLRALLRRPGFDSVARLGGQLGYSARTSVGVLAVGSPGLEPWHLVAHLQNRADFGDTSVVVPTLVRWSVPAGAPAHLSVGLDRIAMAGRGETVMVVAPQALGSGLLERLADARRRGGTILALACDHALTELTEMAHETALVDSEDLESAQHVVPLAAAGIFGASPRFGRRASRGTGSLLRTAC